MEELESKGSKPLQEMFPMAMHNSAGENGNESLAQQQGAEMKSCGTVIGNEGGENEHMSGCQDWTDAGIHQTPCRQPRETETGSGLLEGDKLHPHTVFTGRDENPLVSSETECSFDGDTSDKSAPNMDKINDAPHSDHPGRDNSNEFDYKETVMTHHAVKPNAEPHVEGSSDIACQMDTRKMYSSKTQSGEAALTDTKSHQDCEQEQEWCPSKLLGAEKTVLEDVAHENVISKESMTSTFYLDNIISSIQSRTCNETDTMQISRADLTLMVEQTLAVQTMSNFVQNLVEKNKMLNKQNEVLKYTIVQTQKMDSKVEAREIDNNSMLANQRADTHVFQFPGQLPGNENASNQIQTDSDSISSSLQLPSHICLELDGDNSSKGEVSAAGKTHVATNTLASGAFVPAQEAPAFNIPHDILLSGAECSPQGPQQTEESGVSSGGSHVPREHLDRVVNELEKIKRFMNKTLMEGGIHPNNAQELVNLRGKVETLLKENSNLRMELDNRPVKMPGLEQGHEAAKIKSLEQKLQDQRARENDLLKQFGQLGEENRRLKSSSQPPSSVGLQALPTIPTPATVTVPCQTEQPYPSIEQHAAQLASMDDHLNRMKQQEQLLRHHLDVLNETLKQAQKREEDLVNNIKKLHSQLSLKTDESAGFQQSVRILHLDVQELNHRMITLSTQNEELKQKLLQEAEKRRHLETISQEADKHRKKFDQEVDRNKQLEKMIEDERKRYARDERELLNQIRILTDSNKDSNRQVILLKQLVLAIDRARTGLTTLSQDCVNFVEALKLQHPGAPPSSRTPSSSSGSSGHSDSRFPQHGAGVAHAGTVAHQRSGQQGSRHVVPSGHGGPYPHASSSASPGASSPASLPPGVSRQGGQPLQQAVVQGHGGQKSSGQGRSALSGGSPGSAMNSSQHRYQ